MSIIDNFLYNNSSESIDSTGAQGYRREGEEDAAGCGHSKQTVIPPHTIIYLDTDIILLYKVVSFLCM